MNRPFKTISARIGMMVGLSCAALAGLPPCNSQTTTPTTGQFTCAVSECRMNQSSGSSSSVGVGVTSSFGVNSSAQSTSNYNASASASLLLNGFAGSPPSSATTNNFNSSLQSVGNPESEAPITLTITSDAIQSKSKDGNDTSFFNANKYTSEENNGSNADFSAAGFSASQDLRFKGGAQSTEGTSSPTDSGSEFTADVIKLVEKTGGPEVGTGNSNAGSETRTRFQADITTSTFVNAFMSSF